MHYYKFHIGDYASHTAHLSPLEDVAYRRLMDLYYLSDAPVPGPIEKIAKKIRMQEHCTCIASVLAEFFTLENNYYKHKRIERELKSYRALSKKRQKAANTRWANKDVPLRGDANALQMHSTSNANHKPITSNHEPLTIGLDSHIESSLPADDKPGKNNVIAINQVDVPGLPTMRYEGHGEEFCVREDLYLELLKTYPFSNIPHELQKMRTWLLSNKTKRKTARGMPRFINNWLSTDNDKDSQYDGGI